MKLPKILLAEDNDNDIELVLTALADNNLMNEIVVARDGEAALDFLYRRGEYTNIPPGNPAVILLDLKMPKLNGIDVIKTIKNDEKLHLIPIVVLTSSRMESDVVETYNLGINAYVVKPVDFQEFVSAIREIGAFWAILNETPVERNE